MLAYRVLTGPTASGKTDWLLRRAENVPIRVISADSRQVYRYMDIGTGKPGAPELERVPHYGLDLIDPGESFSAHEFILMCSRAYGLSNFAGEVWVCGGTGLYIRTLVDSLPLGPPPRPHLRAALAPLLKQRGSRTVAADLGLKVREDTNPVRVTRHVERMQDLERAYKYVGLDPQFAASDVQHSAEEYEAALAWIRAEWRCEGIYVLDPGPVLEERIGLRVAGMFTRGLTQEVRELRDRGFGETDVVANGIAYREAGRLLDGAITSEMALSHAIVRTRQYAKRQRTYFRGRGWQTYSPTELDALLPL